MSVSLFIDGQKDCREGIPPQSEDKSYVMGYSYQYEIEQINTAISEMIEGKL